MSRRKGGKGSDTTHITTKTYEIVSQLMSNANIDTRRKIPNLYTLDCSDINTFLFNVKRLLS